MVIKIGKQKINGKTINNMKNIHKYFNCFMISLLVFIASCSAKKQLISLRILQPTVLKQNGSELFQYWEFPNSSLLWDTNFSTPKHIKLYKDSLNSKLSSDTSQSIIQKMAFQDIIFKSVETQNGDSINAQLIHSKVLGKIRPINYLEAELLNYQMNRYPLLSHPTEFHGFILVQDSLNIVRVYFAASDQPWPPRPSIILSAVENDLKNGWNFKYHLHNHYDKQNI